MNKNIWKNEEYRIIAKHCSSKSIDEITVLVNEVSQHVRTPLAVRSAGNKRGFSFKVVT
jgi:hypothetical protein